MPSNSHPNILNHNAISFVYIPIKPRVLLPDPNPSEPNRLHKFFSSFSLSLLLAFNAHAALIAGENLVPNPGFESDLNGWRVWSRTPNTISAIIDTLVVHSGHKALHLQHQDA